MVTTAPPLVLVSNTLRWQEVRNPGGSRFGSRLLFCFLPFMAVMDFLRFPPFPLLLLCGCGHYVALRKWITTERSALPLLCRMFLCLQNQARDTEVFDCCICFRDFMRGHGVSKSRQAGEVLRLSPMFPHLL